MVFPLAPPRMMPGFVDTGLQFGQSVYGAERSGGVANQFAAMPSLHVGWAALIALSMILITRSKWRWLWLAHPIITFGVVVVTANHYWLDGIVALLLLAVSLPLLLRPGLHEDRLRTRNSVSLAPGAQVTWLGFPHPLPEVRCAPRYVRHPPGREGLPEVVARRARGDAGEDRRTGDPQRGPGQPGVPEGRDLAADEGTRGRPGRPAVLRPAGLPRADRRRRSTSAAGT